MSSLHQFLLRLKRKTLSIHRIMTIRTIPKYIYCSFCWHRANENPSQAKMPRTSNYWPRRHQGTISHASNTKNPRIQDIIAFCCLCIVWWIIILHPTVAIQFAQCIMPKGTFKYIVNVMESWSWWTLVWVSHSTVDWFSRFIFPSHSLFSVNSR